jgi:hypothetical protein
VLCDDIAKFVMDVRPPINIIPIGRIGKPGKQSKLQMIVDVDETWHNQKTAEVDLRMSRLRDFR